MREARADIWSYEPPIPIVITTNGIVKSNDEAVKRLLRRAISREKTMKLVKQKEAQIVQDTFLQPEQGTRPSLADSERSARTQAQEYPRNDDSRTP